jgi:hypothetical protein
MRNLGHRAGGGAGGLQFGQREFGVVGCSCHLGSTIIGGSGEDLCSRQPRQVCEPG